METNIHNPSFTVSLRGYDREEVDDYLDSLAEALERVESAEEHTRQLQSHINRLNARIKELEDRLKSESPKSGLAVGERIGMLLREAEETAEDTINRAEARAAEIVTAADERSEQAEQIIRSANSRAEEQARRIEAAARGEAADIVAEAEGRAAARTRQIEQWAEQVISHTRAEEARMLQEHKASRERFSAELGALADQRSDAHRVLTELRESLGQALGLAATEPPETPAEVEPEAVETVDQREETVIAESSSTSAAPLADEDRIASATPAGSEDDEHFEEKLEAWVNWESDQPK